MPPTKLTTMAQVRPSTTAVTLLAVALQTLGGIACGGLSFSPCGGAAPTTTLAQTASVLGSGVSGAVSIYFDSGAGSNVLRLESISVDGATFVRAVGDGGAISEVHQLNCTDGNSNINLTANGSVIWVAITFLDGNNISLANTLATASF